MDMNGCKLQMLDLYFSKCNFRQVRGQKNQEYNTSFQIEYAVNNEDPSKIKVTIDTAVSNENESIVVNLQTVAIFKIEKEGIDDSTYDHLIKVNTVAIVFPFIRSQISLMTTQPGITPVMLPPININALVEKQ